MRFLLSSCFLALSALMVQAQPASLEGRMFNITVILAKGFVEKTEDGGWQGYVIDMIETVSQAAGFTYELFTPSGFGSLCPEPLDPATATAEDAYPDSVTSAYLCGQGDTLDPSVPDDYKTDMYWSMYFVTTGRQAEGKFSLPFKPPFSGLTMYGTATGLNDINDLIAQQAAGTQGPACVGENTAYGNFLATSLPDLKTVAITNTNEAAQAALRDGTCDILINAEHAAVEFVKASKDSDQCNANGKPIGVIGEGLKFGLTQMAIGINNGVDEDTIRAINYHLNTYMTCAPGDANGACEVTGSFYDSWATWAGTGLECGYGMETTDDSHTHSESEGTTTTTTEEEGEGTETEVEQEENGSSGRRLHGSVIVGGLGSLFRAFE